MKNVMISQLANVIMNSRLAFYNHYHIGKLSHSIPVFLLLSQPRVDE